LLWIKLSSLPEILAQVNQPGAGCSSERLGFQPFFERSRNPYLKIFTAICAAGRFTPTLLPDPPLRMPKALLEA
jgi:hypothetical protein